MANTAQRRKSSPAGRVAAAGIVAALSLALLYLLYAQPVLKFSLLFVLSLLPVTLAYEKRYADALLAYAAAALLSGILFPAGSAWLMYVAFFGWYGVLREIIVTKWNRVLSWTALVVLFNAAFFALYFLATQFVPSLNLPGWLQPLVIPAAEIAFVLFEVLFGLCREYYIRRVRRMIARFI